jgi:membrane associated rhomboid family serine protease
MRQPPPWTTFPKYPITTGTILLAAAASLAYWSGHFNIEPLVENIGIRRGQLWRLLTSAFPHGNILHLLFNLYWTWTFGTLLEERLGHFKTLALFLLFAFVANGAEYAFLDGGIGLSGIGYGLFGLLWILSRHDPRFANAVDPKTVLLFIGWFFFCILLTVMGSPIANIAHGVGALTGILLAFSLVKTPKPALRPLAAAAVTLLFLSTFVTTTIARPFINLSKHAGEEEAFAGYQALLANHNEEAARWLTDATRMQPAEPRHWFNLGIADERLGQLPEARAAYQRAHTLDPTNPKYEVPDLDPNPTTTESSSRPGP